MKRTVMASALATALTLSISGALAATQEQEQEQAQEQAQTQTKKQAQTQKQEPIYGSHMMTRKERAEYHAKMRAAKTAEEREQIRKEHHELMKERAKQRGITLPDEPPAGGMGPGGRMGPGGGMMGPGGGMGPRGGR